MHVSIAFSSPNASVRTLKRLKGGGEVRDYKSVQGDLSE